MTTATTKKKSGKVKPKYRGDRTHMVFHKGILVAAYADEGLAEQQRNYRANMFGEGCTVTQMKDAQSA